MQVDLSSEYILSTFEHQHGGRKQLTVSKEMGPIAESDVSEGLLYQLWTAKVLQYEEGPPADLIFEITVNGAPMSSGNPVTKKSSAEAKVLVVDSHGIPLTGVEVSHDSETRVTGKDGAAFFTIDWKESLVPKEKILFETRTLSEKVKVFFEAPISAEPRLVSGYTRLFGVTSQAGVRREVLDSVPSSFIVVNDPSSWSKTKTVDAGQRHVMRVRLDGTVELYATSLIAGFFTKNLSSWSGVISTACGLYHAACLKSDGTVLSDGRNTLGQTNTETWSDVVDIAAGFNSTAGLKSDGTILYTMASAPPWSNIVQVDVVNGSKLVGLRDDGSLVSDGYSNYIISNFNSGPPIKKISCSLQRAMAVLREDGTVSLGIAGSGVIEPVYVGTALTNVEDIAVFNKEVLGLRPDGSVVSSDPGRISVNWDLK